MPVRDFRVRVSLTEQQYSWLVYLSIERRSRLSQVAYHLLSEALGQTMVEEPNNAERYRTYLDLFEQKRVTMPESDEGVA